MPSSLINLFYFYSRYLWNKDDFSDFQDALINSLRGSFEGFTGGAILSGLTVTQVSGNQIRVSSGIAIGVDGSLMYLDADYDLTLSAPVSDAERTLIVLRPKQVSNTEIDDPVNPGSTVYLKEQQTCEVIVIRGTAAASPVYPSKGANDVVLAGVRVKTSGTIDGNWDFDYSVREILGRNRTSQRVDQSLYDDRLRPYRYSAVTIGIKPSIIGYPGSGGDSATPIAFTMIDQQVVSLFPRTGGGAFNFADTYVNMETGAITGGDGLSPDFTPATVSAADRYRVGLIQIGTDDILNVKHHSADSTTKAAAYGLIFDATIKPDPGYKLICYFVLYSAGGSVWQDLDLIDARNPGSVVHSGDFGSKTITTSGRADVPTIRAKDANGIKFQENGGTEIGSFSDSGAFTAGPTTGSGSETATDALEHTFYGGLNVKPSTGASPSNGGDIDCDFIVPYVAGAAYLLSQTVYSNSDVANCQTKIFLAIEKASGQFSVSTIGTTTGGTGVTIPSDPLFSRSGDVLTITISTDHSGVTGTIRQGIVRFG